MFVVQNKEKIESIGVLVLLGLIALGKVLLASSIQTNGLWEWWLSSIALLFVLPFGIAKYFFQSNFYSYNLVRTVLAWKWAVALVITGGGIVLLYGLVVQLGVDKYIPVSPWLVGGVGLTLFMDLLLVPGKVLANEFFFRGMLMGSLQKAWGIVPALIVQTVCASGYTVLAAQGFFTKGITVEVGVKVGIFLVTDALLGVIAWWTKSIYVSAFCGWMIVFTTDIFVLFHYIH